jgi:ribosomal protein S18 acetylase RimI-like enzyme
MAEPVIRRAIAADIPDIRALTIRAYTKWLDITPRPPRPMTANYCQAFVDHRFDLLIDIGHLIGLIETIVQDDELMIVNVAIDPKRQGEGHGVRLMRHAEEIARLSGLTGTRLYTNKLMNSNIALYEQLGYKFEKETLHDLGTVAVHMTKSLTTVDARQSMATEAACTCGRSKVRCSGKPERVSVCHCLSCKRRTGSAFSWNATYRAENIVSDGNFGSFTRATATGRTNRYFFCMECGATVFYEVEMRPGMLSVPAGLFADPGFPEPVAQVFEDRCVDWCKIAVCPERIKPAPTKSPGGVT